MFFWNAYPFIRYTLLLSCGILAGLSLERADSLFSIALGCWVALALLYAAVLYAYLQPGKAERWKPWLGATGVPLLFASGLLLPALHDESGNKDHISHLPPFHHYQAIIVSEPADNGANYSMEAEIRQVRLSRLWEKASGKVLLYAGKHLDKPPGYGDCILVQGSPSPLSKPLNPYEFNYKEYLQRHNIFFSDRISGKNIKLLRHSPVNPLMAFAIDLRLKCDRILKKNIHSETEYQVAAALMLGIKGNLDEEIKRAYSDTGVIHVLAVSGLHIAILFELCLLLFGAVGRLKYGNAILYFGILVLLWLFAFISGLSPSVLRAVVMFSFILIARLIQRNADIYNTLAASAFFLLCCNPFFLLDAGFQLSYAAVIGIVYLQPKIYHVFDIRNAMLDKLWALSSVTLAAQAATLPLILHYFHKFPVWFLPANMIMVPGTSLLLYIGLVLLLTSWIPIVAGLLGECIRMILQVLHFLLLKTEQLPGATVTGIHVPGGEACLLYLIMFLLFAFIAAKKLHWLLYAVILSCCFSAIQIFRAYEQNKQKMLVVYAIRNAPVSAFVNGRNMALLCDSVYYRQHMEKRVMPHLARLGIQTISFLNHGTGETQIPHKTAAGHTMLAWEGKSIVLKQGASIPSIPCDYLIDLQTDKKNIKSEEHPSFKKIIVSLRSENYFQFRAMQKLKKLNLPHYNLAEEGAFIEFPGQK